METNFGYLLKKKKVVFEGKNYEIFELKDFVLGFSYRNTDKSNCFNVVSGKYAGEYAYVLEENKDYENVVVLRNLVDCIRENDNKVNFLKIREKKLDGTSKYYEKKDNSDGLTSLHNKELITFLEVMNNSEQNEFGEEAFENTTDISKMYRAIKETVISQDEQIMQILTSLYKNQKVINSNFDIDLIAKLKENILIYGSTGTGKTEILKRISRLYDIPIVIEDATSLSETGYTGRKITDMLEDLYLAANKDIKLAEKGILVIDEFDKLAEKDKDGQSHVSRIGVQRSLLKLLDGSLFYFNNIQFNTSKLTVVALGAFTGIIDGDDYSNLTTDAFIKFGIIRELMGRFSKRVAMNPLSKEDIVKILKYSNFSPINTYRELFKELNIDFLYNDDFIEWVAEKAVSLNSGARSLKTVFDECIDSALFRIFAGEYSAIELVRPNDEDKRPYILTKKK